MLNRICQIQRASPYHYIVKNPYDLYLTDVSSIITKHLTRASNTGTVADMWEAHQRGEETSLNPLGMVEALIGAMQHAAALDGASADNDAVVAWTENMRRCIHRAMVEVKEQEICVDPPVSCTNSC